jgi:phage repressor protein C with HTH and peptisase S24 domain
MTQISRVSGPAERILQLIDLFETKTPSGLARKAGVPRSTITNVIFRNAIGPQTATVLANALKIRQEWVQFGTGPIFEEDLPSGAYSLESSAVRRLVEQPVLEGAEPELICEPSNFVYVRKAEAKLSAGGGLIPDEGFREERYAFRLDWLKTVATSPKNVILMEVEGDSMSPSLQNGNLVLIDIGRRSFRPGKLFAIGVGDVIQIKRLDIIPPAIIRIYSDNSMYPTSETTPEELRIIGQLIWSARTWV